MGVFLSLYNGTDANIYIKHNSDSQEQNNTNMNGEKRYMLIESVLTTFKENDIILNSDTFFEL